MALLWHNITSGLGDAIGKPGAGEKFKKGLLSFGQAISAGIASFVRMILDKLITPMVDWIGGVLDKAAEKAKGQQGWSAK